MKTKLVNLNKIGLEQYPTKNIIGKFLFKPRVIIGDQLDIPSLVNLGFEVAIICTYNFANYTYGLYPISWLQQYFDLQQMTRVRFIGSGYRGLDMAEKSRISEYLHRELSGVELAETINMNCFEYSGSTDYSDAYVDIMVKNTSIIGPYVQQILEASELHNILRR